MKKLYTFLVILLILSFFPEFSHAQENSSYAYVVMDRHTGDVLISNMLHERIYPASTTKIMTALVALENTRPDAIMKASQNAVSGYEWGAVLLNIQRDEEIILYDLLNAILLRSANDAAVVIAENIAGSEEEFNAMMNERAKSAGALDTNFENSHGLHSDNHYSTVYDLAVITRAALNNNIFKTLVSQREYIMSSTNKRDSFPKIINTNPILGINKGTDFIVLGVKTGYTSKARDVLVSYADNFNGREVICVVSALPSRAESAALSLELIKRGFDDFGIHTLVKPGEVISDYIYEDTSIPLAVSKPISYLLPNDTSKWLFEKNVTLYNDIINTTVTRGDILGEVEYNYKGKAIGTSYLVAAQSFTFEKAIETVDVNIPSDKPEQANEKSDSLFVFIIFFAGAIIILFIFIELHRIKKA